MGGFSVHSIGDLALPVFAFYMLILSNFLGETLGCNLQKIMRYNMFAKHLVGYSLLLFLVIFSDEANRRPLAVKIIIAGAIYIWFFFTTKCPAPIMLAVLALLLVTYVIGKQSSGDPEYLEDKGPARKAQTILSASALVLSVAGFAVYVQRKRRDIGTGFSLPLMLTDTLRCAHHSHNNQRPNQRPTPPHQSLPQRQFAAARIAT
jgi:hypothetical protein